MNLIWDTQKPIILGMSSFQKENIAVHHIFALQRKMPIHQIKAVVHSSLAIY